MSNRHFNVRLFIEQVERETGGTYPRNDPDKANRIVRPIEIKVSADTLDSAVRKVKAYLDIEVAEQPQATGLPS